MLACIYGDAIQKCKHEDRAAMDALVYNDAIY